MKNNDNKKLLSQVKLIMQNKNRQKIKGLSRA